MLRRRNQLRAFEDRLTRVLAPIAVVTTGAVLLGEGIRRYRGRVAARRPEDTHILPRAESPAEALEQTNAMLQGRLPSDTFVTAFLAVLSPSCLRWASAGHLP
ncbi:MAG TPA: SpoIIE family protein phosphatase, partial [Solirubrobacterales bacterium]|nr:SpoIIE family protein phosphatase [Solirubrobacterales bacterium]